MAHIVTASERAGSPYAQDIISGNHRLFADEPVSVKGADIGPSPYEYLCAALAACTSMTLRMYAERKDWPLEHVSVQVEHKRRNDGQNMPRDFFCREITLKGDLDTAQRERLLEIANKCPVHRTLENGSDVECLLLDD